MLISNACSLVHSLKVTGGAVSCGRKSWIWVPTVLPGSCEVTGRRVNLEPLFPFVESGMVGGTLGPLRIKHSELTL